MKQLLNYAIFYKLFKFLVSGNYSKKFSANYIKAGDFDRVLDIGSGTSEILYYLPEKCQYVGIDINNNYIEKARKIHKNRGTFIHGGFEKTADFQTDKFDIVLCIGLLHHLNDNEVTQLLTNIKKLLKKNGRLITFDGCFIENQSWIKRKILSMDRGNYVRYKNAYEKLIKKTFFKYTLHIEENMIHIPYTHIIFQCIND